MDQPRDALSGVHHEGAAIQRIPARADAADVI
jgi:hypothetical protein